MESVRLINTINTQSIVVGVCFSSRRRGSRGSGAAGRTGSDVTQREDVPPCRQAAGSYPPPQSTGGVRQREDVFPQPDTDHARHEGCLHRSAGQN